MSPSGPVFSSQTTVGHMCEPRWLPQPPQPHLQPVNPRTSRRRRASLPCLLLLTSPLSWFWSSESGSPDSKVGPEQSIPPRIDNIAFWPNGIMLSSGHSHYTLPESACPCLRGSGSNFLRTSAPCAPPKTTWEKKNSWRAALCAKSLFDSQTS